VKKHGRIVNVHHVSYDPEVTVKMFKGEHRCVTLMERYSRRTVSRGFIKCLKVFAALNEDRAVAL